jgi:hypothetical protein
MGREPRPKQTLLCSNVAAPFLGRECHSLSDSSLSRLGVRDTAGGLTCRSIWVKQSTSTSQACPLLFSSPVRCETRKGVCPKWRDLSKQGPEKPRLRVLQAHKQQPCAYSNRSPSRGSGAWMPGCMCAYSLCGPCFFAPMAKSDAQAGIRSQHSVPCPVGLVSALVVPAWVKENRRPGVRVCVLVMQDGSCDRLLVVAVNLAGTWALFSPLPFQPAASHGLESFAGKPGIEIAVLSDQCQRPTTARRPRPSLVCQPVSSEASQVSQLLSQCLFSPLHPFSRKQALLDFSR